MSPTAKNTDKSKLITIKHATVQSTSKSITPDDEAQLCNEKQLMAEYGRKIPNKQLMKDLIKETYEKRRRYIESSTDTINFPI